MPRNVTAVELSDVDMDEPRKNKKNTAANGGSDEVADESGSEGEGEEEEYEIENVLGHKYNMVQFGGRIGYLVKWKGYPDSENSYVDEQDAHGAKDLIEAYWKSISKKGKKPAGGRKSAASAPEVAEEPEEVTPPPQPKKRGRPPKSKTPEDVDESEEEEVAPKKKAKPAPRKSGGAASKGRKSKAAPAAEDDPANEELGSMDRWKEAPSWDHLVESIDTVERIGSGLVVYFTLNNKSATKAGFTRCRESSELCKKKMPGKLLEFYESNLRWKEADEEDS